MQEYEKTMASPAPVPSEHPLRELFYNMVTQAFHDRLGVPKGDISVYLANMLTDFAHRDNIYRIHDAQGRALSEVAEMLLEADMSAHAPSFEQERAVHRHIGDFTLFWTGIYPEALRQLRAPSRADHLLDYVRQGKQSYYIVSTFQYGPFSRDAGLFRQLSEDFELCMYGLSLVRREWQRLSASQASL